MIKGFLESRLAQVGVVLIFAFWLTTAIVDFGPLNLVATSFGLVIAVAVALAYGAEALDALTLKTPSRGHILALGICLSWVSFAGQRIVALGYRLSGNDPMWLLSNVLTFLFYLSCLAGVLHLTAPKESPPLPRTRAWLSLWVTLTVGLVVAAFVVGFHWGER